MSCAAPVIVTDGGALPEVVGEAGIVVRRGDPEALAIAISQLLDDPAKRLALGEASRRRAREVFSWDRAGAAYEAVLEDAVIAAC
jgi:glycosyltransferase involved in cell wall biosynthesis